MINSYNLGYTDVYDIIINDIISLTSSTEGIFYNLSTKEG